MNRRVCVNDSTGFDNSLLNSVRLFVTPVNGSAPSRLLVGRNCANNGETCRLKSGARFDASSEKSMVANRLNLDLADRCLTMVNLVNPRDHIRRLAFA